jgi:GMP synthase (glutamine-hydrolysing)
MDKILILDFGSQVTQLIARRVREAGVYCEIQPFNRSDEQVRAYGAKGIILSGGPCSTLDAGSPRAPAGVFDLGLPILSICYGQQTTCLQLGGKVEGGHAREFGKAQIDIKKPSALFDGVWNVGDRPQVWMSHGDRVTVLPQGFEVVATSEGAPFAIATNEQRDRKSVV